MRGARCDPGALALHGDHAKRRLPVGHNEVMISISHGTDWLTDRLDSGDVVIIDGATGTELEARGVPMARKGWSVLAQLDFPEVLQSLHEDYIRAGASVITTNTFATGRHMLEPGGLGDRVAEAHLRAAEIARQARDAVGEQVAIAGSVSCYMADDSDPYWLGRLRETYAEQVELLVRGGVDLVALEMMERPRYAVPAVQAAVASGLPVWVGLTARRQPGSSDMSTFDYPDAPFQNIVEAVLTEPVAAVCVMHTAVTDVGPALEIVREYWHGPLGAYPESGFYEEPHWRITENIDPDDLVAYALEWVRSGVQIVGGCCGLGVDHIRAVSEGLRDPRSEAS